MCVCAVVECSLEMGTDIPPEVLKWGGGGTSIVINHKNSNIMYLPVGFCPQLHSPSLQSEYATMLGWFLWALSIFAIAPTAAARKSRFSS